VRKTTQTEYQSEAAQLPVGKVQKKAKARKNIWGRYFFMVIIVVAIAISITGRYAEIARTNYEIAKLKYAVAKLEKENEAMQINVASLKAPGRVQQIAVSRLGMQLPDKVYYASSQPTGPQKQADVEAVRTATVSPLGAIRVEARSRQ
jgi:cell division protein FtsL